ncbi:MAG TPA: hypothetical protein VMD30_09905, partial [Tepidisphaeraceae bacterium]|nr:hypothetical protein [Tepidisphaeraceae bacterium]
MRIIPPSFRFAHRANTRGAWPAALLTLAVSATTIGLCGCDSPESLNNKKVEETIQKAQDIAAVRPTDAENMLRAAASTPEISFDEAARAAGLCGHAYFSDGQTLARLAQEKEIDIARLIDDIDLNVNAVAKMQQAIAEQLQSNPQPVLNQLLVQISLARGDAGPDGKIPEYWTPLKPIAIQPLPPETPTPPENTSPSPTPAQNSSGGFFGHLLGGFTHSSPTNSPT